MNPFVSIIIPVYNVEDYLSKCIESVIGQTYNDLEVILIDDGSTDESGRICDKYALRDDRIKVVHQNNKGVSAARNLGLVMSNGRYAAFVDGDDWIEKDMFSFLIGIARQSDADIAACGYYRSYAQNHGFEQDGAGEPRRISQEAALKLSLDLNEDSWEAAVSNKIFRTEILKANNIVFDEEIAYGEDMLWQCQCILSSSKIMYSSIPKYHSVVSAMSATRKPFYSKKASLVKAHERLEELVRERYPQLIPTIRQRSAASSYRLLREAVRDGSTGDIEAIKRLQNDMRRNLAYALTCESLTVKDKTGLILAAANLALYRRVRLLYRFILKKERWHL